MAVVTRRFERNRPTELIAKGKGRSAWRARFTWALGSGGMVLAVMVAIHALNRLGVEAVVGWDLIGSVIGFSR